MKKLDEKIDSVTSGVEEITPDLAAEMLANNTLNRSLRRQVVAAYARDMTEGRWRFTGSPILFAEDGELLDGQHRLHAIVASGVALDLVVMRGMPVAVRDVVDTGAVRTAGDVVKFHGEANGPALSAAARLILTEGNTITMKVTNAELIQLIEDDPHLRWVMNEGIKSIYGPLRELITPGVLGYVYWRLHRTDPFAAGEFFHRLATGEDLAAGSPILALRRQLGLIAGRAATRGRVYRQQVIVAVITAWNAWRKGETRQTIRVAPRNGRLTIPEPV